MGLQKQINFNSSEDFTMKKIVTKIAVILLALIKI